MPATPHHPLDSYIGRARPRTPEAVAKAIAECPALVSMVAEAMVDADLAGKVPGGPSWEADVRAGLARRLGDDWPPRPNAKAKDIKAPSAAEVE